VKHAQLTEAEREQATLYALNVLEADEARAFAAHLQAGCEACAAEVAAMRSVAGDLALAAPPSAPSPAVRDRVLADVGRLARGGFRFWPARDAAWRVVAPGVSRRDLGPASFMIRLAPGHTLPRHRHAVAEHCYVLEGDLLVNDQRLEAGDYHEAGPGTLHDGLVTERGCVFLVVESAGAAV
jgi:anti-sigma factor ChrR (cupin superfamily)